MQVVGWEGNGLAETSLTAREPRVQPAPGVLNSGPHGRHRRAEVSPRGHERAPLEVRCDHRCAFGGVEQPGHLGEGVARGRVLAQG